VQANTQNRLLSAAALALAAGSLGFATPSAKADVDFSLSLNFGWCAPDPYCAPVVYNSYCGWWSDPCPPRWGWHTSCAPWYYRPYYATPYYNPYYRPISCQPFYAPVWTYPGTTISYSYSSWGGGWGYTSTTYYSPYYDYYQPASFWGLSFTFGDCDRDDWRWRNRYDRRWDRDHGHHDRGHDNVTVINNGGTVNVNSNGSQPQVGRGMRQTQGIPQAQKPLVGPVMPAAESFGVAGPPAAVPASTPAPASTPVFASKGPARITPVAVKPIESQPLNQKPVYTEAKPFPSKPVLPVLTTGKPSGGPQAITQKPGRAEQGPFAPVEKPSAFTQKPDASPAKPVLPVLAPSPRAPQVAEGKAPIEVDAKPSAQPVRDNSPYPIVGKTPTRFAPPSPTSKPVEVTQKPAEKPAAPVRQAPQPTRYERPAYTPPAAPAPRPQAKPVQEAKPAPAPRQAPAAPAAKAPAAAPRFAPPPQAPARQAPPPPAPPRQAPAQKAPEPSQGKRK